MDNDAHLAKRKRAEIKQDLKLADEVKQPLVERPDSLEIKEFSEAGFLDAWTVVLHFELALLLVELFLWDVTVLGFCRPFARFSRLAFIGRQGHDRLSDGQRSE
jgi:hypothetical protein